MTDDRSQTTELGRSLKVVESAIQSAECPVVEVSLALEPHEVLLGLVRYWAQMRLMRYWNMHCTGVIGRIKVQRFIG